MLRTCAAWVAGAVLLVGCASVQGKFVWVDDFEQKATREGAGYKIVPGDVIWVRVWNQDGMSARSRVREDGKISLPFLNDVEVTGYSPSVLAAQLQTRLKEFINTPVVTVSLEEVKPFTLSVVGEVARPGVYTVEPGSRLMQALAAAGGFTEFAHKDRIFVLRQEPKQPSPTRIRFTWAALTQVEGKAAAFSMRQGDVVVVE